MEMPQRSLKFAFLLVWLMAIPAGFCNDRPAVRVTTGVVEVHGWEGDLLKRNPNLSRWHWNPLYVYKQGVVGGSKKNPPVGGKNPHPANAPTQRSAYTLPESPDGSHYVKPVHVPFSQKALAEVSARAASLDKRTSENLQGKMEPGLPEKVPTPQPEVATYGGTPPESVYEVSTIRSESAVHGQLKENKSRGLKAQTKSLQKSDSH